MALPGLPDLKERKCVRDLGTATRPAHTTYNQPLPMGPTDRSLKSFSDVRRRSREGCLVCRLRKKPCSGPCPGQESTCRECITLHIICLGFPGPRPKWMRDKEKLQRVKDKIKNWTARRGGRPGVLDLSPDCEDNSPPREIFEEVPTSSIGVVVASASYRPATSPPSASGATPSTRPRLTLAYVPSFQLAGPSDGAVHSTGGTLSPPYARQFGGHTRAKSTSSIPTTDREIYSSPVNRPSSSRGYRQQADEFIPNSGQEAFPSATSHASGIPQLYVSPAMESDPSLEGSMQEYLNIDAESWGSDNSSPVSATSSMYSTPMSATSDLLFSPSSPLFSPSSPYLYPPSPVGPPSPSLLSPETWEDGSLYSPTSSTFSLSQDFSNTTLADGFGDRQEDGYIERPLAQFTSNFDSRALDFESSIFQFPHIATPQSIHLEDD